MEVIEFFMILCLLTALIVLCHLLFLDADLLLYLADKFGRPVSSYSGKVVWITGASSGLGEAMAYELATLGAKLVLTARNKDILEEVKARCLDLSQGKLSQRDVLVLPFDLTHYDTHETRVSDVLNHFGEIDVLINNAGVSQIGQFRNTSLKVDEKLFAVNVFGCLALSRLVLKHFLEKKMGQIVVVSSLAGRWSIPGCASYCATKCALNVYFEALHAEHCADNIDVTVVCPGPFKSRLAHNSLSTKEDEVLARENFSSNEMSVSRCAHLTLVSAANKLCETWISNPPLVLLTYFAHYTPLVIRSLMPIVIRLIPELRITNDPGWPRDIPSWKPFFK